MAKIVRIDRVTMQKLLSDAVSLQQKTIEMELIPIEGETDVYKTRCYLVNRKLVPFAASAPEPPAAAPESESKSPEPPAAAPPEPDAKNPGTPIFKTADGKFSANIEDRADENAPVYFFEELDNVQIKEIAAAHGIDLSSVKKKDVALAKIKEVLFKA